MIDTRNTATAQSHLELDILCKRHNEKTCVAQYTHNMTM